MVKKQEMMGNIFDIDSVMFFCYICHHRGITRPQFSINPPSAGFFMPDAQAPREDT